MPMPPPFRNMPAAPGMPVGPQALNVEAAPDWRRSMQMADAMLQQGMGPAPVRHWAEGLGRLAQIVGGGIMKGRAEDARGTEEDTLAKVLTERGLKLPDGVSLSSLPPEVRGELIAQTLSPQQDELVQVWDDASGNMIWIPKSQAQGKGSSVPEAVEFQNKLALATAGRPTTTVINSTPYESEFSKVMGKQGAEYFGGIMSEGATAQSSLATLDQLDAILPKLQTGSLAGLEREVGALAQSLGIDPSALNLQDPGLAQTLTAQATRLRLDLLQNLKGAVTDNEQRMFAAALPSLSNTPQGNQLLSGMMRALSERASIKAQMAQEWAANVGSPFAKNKEGKTFDQVWQGYMQANPVVTPDLQAQIQAMSATPTQQPVAPAVPEPPAGFNMVQ